MYRTTFICHLNLILLLIFSTDLLATPPQSPTTTLNISTFPIDNVLAKSLSAIMKAAYQTMGINMVVHHLPGARSLVEANNGKMDGELFRIKGLEKKYTGLVQVKAPIFSADVSAFTHLKNPKIKNWQDLQPYIISYTLGFQLAQRHTKGNKVIHATDLNHAFRLLINEKVAFVIDDKLNGLQLIKNKNIKGIHLVSPPLASIQIFHYLNSQHAHLIPALEKALRHLHASGRTEQIKNAIISQHLKIL